MIEQQIKDDGFYSRSHPAVVLHGERITASVYSGDSVWWWRVAKIDGPKDDLWKTYGLFGWLVRACEESGMKNVDATPGLYGICTSIPRRYGQHGLRICKLDIKGTSNKVIRFYRNLI